MAIRCLRVLWISTLFCALIAPSFARAQDSSTAASLDYLLQHQDATTGGLVEENETNPSLLQTSWGIVAVASAGYSETGLNSYLAQNACQLTSITDIERTVLAISASDNDPHNFNNCNMVSKLESAIDSGSGLIGTDVVSTIFGALAILSYDGLVPVSTINYLVAQQRPDGGWSSGWGTETNTTAQAVMALANSGYDKQSAVMTNAKQYLKNLQADTGGIKYDTNAWTTTPDAFSDAYTLQAIYALGESPTDSFWQVENKTILDDLDDLRQSNGSYNFSVAWGAMNPVWTTAVVVPALEGKSLGWHGHNLTLYGVTILPISNPTPAPETVAEAQPAPSTPIPSLAQETKSEKVVNVRNNTDTTASSLIAQALPLTPDVAPSITDNTGTIKGATNELPVASHRSTKLPLLLVLAASGLLVGTAISIVGRRYSKVSVLILLFAVTLILPSAARAARAGVVVRHSSGETKQSCVSFSEPTISGFELLKRANMNPMLKEGFITTIDGEQAKSSNEPGASDNYWSYWNLDSGQWQYARLGATYNQVHDGEVDGWQKGGSTLLLTSTSFGQVCPTVATPSVSNTSEPVTEPVPSDIQAPSLAKNTSTKAAPNKTAVAAPSSTEVTLTPPSTTADSTRVAGASATVPRTSYTVVILVTVASIIVGFLATQVLIKRNKH